MASPLGRCVGIQSSRRLFRSSCPPRRLLFTRAFLGARDQNLLVEGVIVTRTNWTRAEIADLFDLSSTELVFRAAEVHRAHHAAGEVQLCTLLSIKTGGCPEDCG